MKRLLTVLCSGLFVCAAIVSHAEEAKKAELKCPVSGKAATKDHALDHNGGKVYFCCDNCPKAFKENTAKFAAKANEQMIVDGQFKQAKCPISGAKLNPDQHVAVDGVEVQFCCDKCKGKVAAAKGDEQLNLVFSDEAFKKGYELKK
jgi:hypothetical protein